MRMTSTHTLIASGHPTPGPCPPPPPGPPPPPAPIPPAPMRDFTGLRFGATTGTWWLPADQFRLTAERQLGELTGYGTWSDAVAAARAASAGPAGAIAICDDRDRLYLYRVITECAKLYSPPLHMRERRETGYQFTGPEVRGIVDGDLIAARGDCLVPWVAAPTAKPA